MSLLGGDRSEAIFIPGEIAGIRKESSRLILLPSPVTDLSGRDSCIERPRASVSCWCQGYWRKHRTGLSWAF